MTTVRQGFDAELDQLRLQVEVMAMRVDHNLVRMRDFLLTGDQDAARAAIAGDDEIDDMNVSLTERCYDLLARESPVASDLRFIMSVLRVLGELERIGDLSLRVVKIGAAHRLVASYRGSFELLIALCDRTVCLFRDVVGAWSAQDLLRTEALIRDDRGFDAANASLGRELLRLEGPDAVAAALDSMVIGKALDRIADHAVIIAIRLRYLLTGDADHLAAEVR